MSQDGSLANPTVEAQRSRDAPREEFRRRGGGGITGKGTELDKNISMVSSRVSLSIEGNDGHYYTLFFHSLMVLH